MYELINGNPLKIKEYRGERVVTFKDIDTIHQRTDGTARRNFNANRKHFIENVDFFKTDQPYEIRTLGIERPQGGTPETVTLITETGYLMLVKSFTDDLAWTVQRELVNNYFRKSMETRLQNGCFEPLMIENIIQKQQELENRIQELEIQDLFSDRFYMDIVKKLYGYKRTCFKKIDLYKIFPNLTGAEMDSAIEWLESFGYIDRNIFYKKGHKEEFIIICQA